MSSVRSRICAWLRQALFAFLVADRFCSLFVTGTRNSLISLIFVTLITMGSWQENAESVQGKEHNLNLNYYLLLFIILININYLLLLLI